MFFFSWSFTFISSEAKIFGYNSAWSRKLESSCQIRCFSKKISSQRCKEKKENKKYQDKYNYKYSGDSLLSGQHGFAKPSVKILGCNIDDIPIVYADNYGNISDGADFIVTTELPPQIPQIHASVILPGSNKIIQISSNPVQRGGIIIGSIIPNPNNEILGCNSKTLQSIPVTNPTDAASSMDAKFNHADLIKYTNVSNASCIKEPLRKNLTPVKKMHPNEQHMIKGPLVNSNIMVPSSIIKGSSSNVEASSSISKTPGHRVEVLKCEIIRPATSHTHDQIRPNTPFINLDNLKPVSNIKLLTLNKNLTVSKVGNIGTNQLFSTNTFDGSTPTTASNTISKVD